ncbi:unnamed protein product [Amoebophrya sp. A25]|nr:unnamed protein product [Amoebophrya sp. A25]|eukprot:GSA25T00003376001.1
MFLSSTRVGSCGFVFVFLELFLELSNTHQSACIFVVAKRAPRWSLGDASSSRSSTSFRNKIPWSSTFTTRATGGTTYDSRGDKAKAILEDDGMALEIVTRWHGDRQSGRGKTTFSCSTTRRRPEHREETVAEDRI